MKAIVGVVRWLISALFLLRRRMGVRHRTCFFSRQASRLTPDFALLQQQLRESILTLRSGDRLSTAFVEEILTTNRFERVDFVYEPGQYSVRGGIIDIFSFSSNVPYRIDFFGDEIDSIRPFDISTQLSTGKLAEVEIVPNLKDIANASARVSFATFAGQAVYWIADGEYTLKRFNDIRTKILGDLENPSENVPFSGLHCYDGHVHTTDLMDREAEVTDLVESIADVLDALSEDGIEVPMIIAGGSPSFPCHAANPDIFLSPGTVFLWDSSYKENYPDLPYIPAAAVCTRVISHPAPGVFTLTLAGKGNS